MGSIGGEAGEGRWRGRGGVDERIEVVVGIVKVVGEIARV